METQQVIAKRKSVRSFSDRPISKETRESLLKAAASAPSAGNMALYSILEIRDPALKEKLAESCDRQAFIAKAPLVLVFCADYKRWLSLFSKHVSQVRQPGSGDLMLAFCDALIAAQTSVLAAEDLGIGSCYIGDILENYEIHRQLLKLPDYVVPAAMVVFGYPDELAAKRSGPRHFEIEGLVHVDGYQDDETHALEDMLEKRQGLSGSALKDWVERFCQRKWNSDFSREMSRSVDAMLERWRQNGQNQNML